MTPDTQHEEWLTIPEAFPQLRRHFRTPAALKHHLRKRETNGLAATGAVRKSPLGMLLINPDRISRWVLGKDTQAAA
jgi:hypothetical protein